MLLIINIDQFGPLCHIKLFIYCNDLHFNWNVQLDQDITLAENRYFSYSVAFNSIVSRVKNVMNSTTRDIII
jgi:hypothetical protein